MKIKHLSALVALATLSLVVACSSGNSGVVPGPSGVAPDSANARTAGGVTAQAKPPAIKVAPASLTFGALGGTKHFMVIEAGYKGTFRIDNPCGKKLAISTASAKGPHAKFDVKPVAEDSCTLTVHDSLKHQATVSVFVFIGNPTPTPVASVTPSPSPSASSSPHSSASPSASPSSAPSASASASPSPSPSSSPATGIKNGNFATGSLSPGWAPCSFAHTALTTPFSPSPEPTSTSAQSVSTVAIASPGAYGNLVTPPPSNVNPNVVATLPPLGSYVAETGDQASENTGASGICQTFTVSASNPYLSFWAYEGGSEYKFFYADQEADILNQAGTAVLQPLYAELNCVYAPGVVGATGYSGGKCAVATAAQPTQSPGPVVQGGFWTQRGPYNLSAYAGQTITLFLGVWDDSTDNTPYPDTYGNVMFVGNVQMTSTNTFPTTFGGQARRAPRHKAARPSGGGFGKPF